MSAAPVLTGDDGSAAETLARDRDDGSAAEALAHDRDDGSAAETLARDGFARLPGLLSPERVVALRAALDAHGDPGASEYGAIQPDPWRRVPALAEEIRRGALALRAMELTGEPEIVLFQDLVFDKRPGTRCEVQWHQDYSYWPLDGWSGLVMWIALDDADPDNGCMRYLPGTHRLGEREPADFIAGVTRPAEAPHLPPLDVASHAARAVWAPARAGDAWVHHPLVWHMSGANGSRRPRRAWNLWWLSARVRWRPDHAPHPCNWELRPQPGGVLDADRFPRFRR